MKDIILKHQDLPLIENPYNTLPLSINEAVNEHFYTFKKGNYILKNSLSKFRYLSLKSNGTYYLYIYNAIVSKGRWSTNGNVLHLTDTDLNSDFTFQLTSTKSFIPIRFLGVQKGQEYIWINKK